MPGVVVDHHWESAGRHGMTCHPVMEFRTADGQLARVATWNGSSPPAAGVGEQVPVVYDPDNLKRVEIDTWAGRTPWVPVFVVVIGLGLIAWAIYHGEV